MNENSQAFRDLYSSLTDYTTTYGVAPVKEKTPQQKLDEALREALAGPAREAEEARQVKEIEKRMSRAKALGQNNDYAFGDVIKFSRLHGQDTEYTESKIFVYIAIKGTNGNWYVTGEKMERAGGWKFADLVDWMITGEHAIFDFNVATEWRNIF